MTKNNTNFVDLLIEPYTDKQSKYNGKYNKTTLFLLKTIGFDIKDRLISKFLRNAYVNDVGIEHDFENCLFLLFKTRSFRDKDFVELWKMKRSPFMKENFLYDYYIGLDSNKDHLIMCVINIPNEWHEDYEKFTNSQYSKFSKEYKSLFPEKVLGSDGKTKESLVWGIINKSVTMKDIVAREFSNDEISRVQLRNEIDSWSEIWDGVKNEEEIYRYGIKV